MIRFNSFLRRSLVIFIYSLGIISVFNVVLSHKQAPIASAQGSINVAAASQGSTVRYYEMYNPSDPFAPAPCRAQFPTSAVIDGDRKGVNFGNGGVFQTCDEQHSSGPGFNFINTGPLIIDFNQLRTINKIDLFTAQDNLNNPIDPTLSTTFATEGTPDFIVSYWDLNRMDWQNIIPPTDWQNNHNVWKSGTFANITTNKIRVNFYMDRVPPSNKFRITEVEAWQANTDHSDFGMQFTLSQATIIGNGQPALATYMFFPNYFNNGSSAGYAPNQGEYYPLIYSFAGIPSGMNMTYPGSTMYSGSDGCLHDDNLNSPPCVNDSNGHRKYDSYGFGLYGNTAPGTYYFNLTATEQLPAGVARQPYTHTYIFRLDVVGASITANGNDSSTTITPGSSATIAWTTLTDPDPSGYTSGLPDCNVSPTGWSGLSGSQSSGPLVVQTTYSVACGFPWSTVSDSVTVNMGVASPSVTAACSVTSNGLYASSSSPGAGITCTLPNNNQPGFIKWTSTNTTTCSVSHNGIVNDELSTTSNSPNPGTAIVTTSLNNPPASHTFTIKCDNSITGTSATDTVTFNVPNNGSYNLQQSAKHVITANQTNLTSAQLAALNTNPCDGSGRTSDPNYNFKENDVLTFAINVCNTGNADLLFFGSGDNSHTIILTDNLGNLAKPAGGWNAQVSCGNDCQLANVDDSQAGKVIFTIQVKAGGNNRLIAQGGSWALFFNAIPKAPASASQPYYYFTNCVTNTTVNNTPAATAIYRNITGSTFDIPGFCLQALFSRGGSAPDRHEIAP